MILDSLPDATGHTRREHEAKCSRRKDQGPLPLTSAIGGDLRPWLPRCAAATLTGETTEGALVHFLQPTTTPGLVMAVHDLLRRVSDPADEQIREALAGNLCRCTGYQKIITAVHVAARNTNGRHVLSHEEVEEHSHAIPE
jgi:hypothetical protein